MTSTTLRRTAAAAATLVLAASLTACGGDDSSSNDASDSSGDSVISADDLSGALLTTDDLPEGFAESQDDDAESDTGTCLDDIANLDKEPGFEADEKADAEFTVESDAGQSQVSASLDSYEDESAAGDAVDLFLQTAQGCTSAQGTDPKGVTYDLTLTTTDDVTLDGADRQVKVDITGTLAAQGQTFPLTFGFLVATTGNDLAAVGASDLGPSAGVSDQIEDLAQTQFDRLADLS